MKKQKSGRILFATLATIGTLACYSQTSFAWDDHQRADEGRTGQGQTEQGQRPGGEQQPGQGRMESPNKHHKELKNVFKLGVCVGQSLAEQGVMITPSELSKGAAALDPTKKEALKKCAKKCLIEMRQAASTEGSTTPSEPADQDQPSDQEQSPGQGNWMYDLAS